MRKNSSDYLEMLFENRNKTYGAYDLRANYENRLIKSFGMALLIAGFFFLIPFVLTKVLKQTRHVEDEIIMLCNMPREFTFEKEKPVATPVRPKPKVQASDSYKIEKKEITQEKEVRNDPVTPGPSLGDNGTGLATDSNATGNTSSSNADSSDSKIYYTSSVDVIPAFPGGEEALLKYLSKYIHYPGPARENNITGRVYVSFIIDEKGKVTDIKILRGLGYGTDDEVARVVRKMPDWSPGKYQGRNVKTAFVLPVLFSLK